MADTTATPRDAAAAARTPRPAGAPADRAAERRARLWAIIHDDTAPQGEYFQAWLALQCESLPGAAGGLLLLRTAEGGTAQQAAWPAGRDPADLLRLGERALAEQRSVVAWGRREPGAQGAVALFVAQPLGPDAAPHAAVAVALAVPGGIDRADPEGIARQLRAAGGWLDAWRWRQPLQAAQNRIAIAAAGLDILAATGEQKGLTASAMALVNSLAARLACDRVSLGLARRSGVRLQAVSHAAEFQQGGRIADAIEDAMDEALGQDATVTWPQDDANGTARRIAVAHRDLAGATGGRGALASVVLPGPGGKPAAVLTLERHREAPFAPDELRLAETVAALTGPLIALHGAERRWISGRLRDLATGALTALFGPARPALKLAACLALALLATLALVEGEYRVTARSVVEGEIQRAAVAPFDGYIRTAPVRAGDTVRAGDILATLDDRDLALDRLKWQAERDKLSQKHREALAKRERATMAVLSAQLAQAEAELSLAEEKLARSRSHRAVRRAGRLRRPPPDARLAHRARQGAVRTGPASGLAPGAEGRRARSRAGSPPASTANSPSPPCPPSACRSPSAASPPSPSPRTGATSSASRRALDAASDGALRPGMEGVAKIETGPRRLLWIWTHAVLDWLRLAAWQWLP